MLHIVDGLYVRLTVPHMVYVEQQMENQPDRLHLVISVMLGVLRLSHSLEGTITGHVRVVRVFLVVPLRFIQDHVEVLKVVTTMLIHDHDQVTQIFVHLEPLVAILDHMASLNGFVELVEV